MGSKVLGGVLKMQSEQVWDETPDHSLFDGFKGQNILGTNGTYRDREKH